MLPDKGHPSPHQYANQAEGPQELPTEASSSAGNRTSELPADAGNPHRYSELPAGAALRPAELESPHVSPRPLQSEFSTDMAKRTDEIQGLGVHTDRTLRIQ